MDVVVVFTAVFLLMVWGLIVWAMREDRKEWEARQRCRSDKVLMRYGLMVDRHGDLMFVERRVVVFGSHGRATILPIPVSAQRMFAVPGVKMRADVGIEEGLVRRLATELGMRDGEEAEGC